MSELKSIVEQIQNEQAFLNGELAAYGSFNTRQWTHVPIEKQLDAVTQVVIRQGELITQMLQYLDRVADAALQEFDI